MNLNYFNPPYLLWREDFVSNTFFSMINQYFGVRSLQGKNNVGLLLVFHLNEPLTNNDLIRITTNFNLFNVIASGTGTVTYQCRIDTRDGIYNFQIQLVEDDTVASGTVLLYSITSSGSAAESYTDVPQTDFTNPIFVMDNCYDPAVDDSLNASTPIARNGAVTITFSEAIKFHNVSNVQIYKGLSSESNYSFVSNGSTMDSGLLDVGDVIINDENGQRVLISGATATDIAIPIPPSADIIQSSSYQVSVIATISGDVLTITPSTGTFTPGKYIYYIAPDGITDIAGNFYAGNVNMFLVS
jgi:hypothetical protein